MATPNSKASTQSGALARAARWRKLARTGVLALAGLFVLVLVIFFLLPVWISNEQGRIYVLDRLNRRLNGPRVTVDAWSVGWFRSTELQNVRILQPDGTPLLSSPRVMSGLTLWDLLWGNYDLGNTTAENLEMRIVKFVDGSTSLDSFTQGAGDVVRSLRGALQISGAQAEIVSAGTGQSVRYVDVKATITIASPDAPFRVQASGLSPSGGSLNLSATLPPTRVLSGASWSFPGVWSVLGDIDLTATRLPAGMVCDFLGIDGDWTESLGESLETVQFSGHSSVAAAQEGTRMTLYVQGSPPAPARRANDGKATSSAPRAAEIPAFRARMSIRSADGSGVLTIGGGDALEADLRLSRPLVKLLGRLNPALGEASGAGPAAGGGSGLFSCSISALSLPLDIQRLDSAQGAARLSFPALVFTPHDGPSLVRQLEVIGGSLPRPGGGTRTEGSAGLMRVLLKDREFRYDNFLVGLGRKKVYFSGTVGLNGKLDLQATIPDETAGTLSAGWTRVTIVRTVDDPLVNRN